MSQNDPISSEDAVDKDIKELLAEVEKEQVPPRLRELAYRLQAALADARSRRGD